MPSAYPKTCFVTVGATANFNGLIRAVLSPKFFVALELQGYKEVIVQYGEGGDALFHSCVTVAKNTESGSVIGVKGFPLDTSGLEQYMLQARGTTPEDEGVVISHAGSGTVLSVLRMSIPIIVVPNEELLDNHQYDLAEELASQGYVVHGKLGKLAEALEEANALGKKRPKWPPVNCGDMVGDPTIKRVIDEELGNLE